MRERVGRALTLPPARPRHPHPSTLTRHMRMHRVSKCNNSNFELVQAFLKNKSNFQCRSGKPRSSCRWMTRDRRPRPGVRGVGSGNIETFPVENQRREVFMIGKSRRVKRALNMLQAGREDLVSTEGRERKKQSAINRLGLDGEGCAMWFRQFHHLI